MRFSGIVSVTVLALTFVPSYNGADLIEWGSAKGGLRLGAARGPNPSKPTLRVLFQNVSLFDQDVLIGAKTGDGPIYEIKFIAMLPDGKSEYGKHRSAFRSVAGMLEPAFLHLSAGETRELEFPLTDILYVDSSYMTLDSLLQHGYSVRVQFDVNQRAAAQWPSLANARLAIQSSTLSYAWEGTLSSGVVSSMH